jgi:hypothetical protein
VRDIGIGSGEVGSVDFDCESKVGKFCSFKVGILCFSFFHAFLDTKLANDKNGQTNSFLQEISSDLAL